MCALGISQLKQLENFKGQKRSIFQSYTDKLSNIEGITLPIERSDVNVNWHLFPIRVASQKREAIFSGLRNAGIGVQVNYIPAYWHPVFREMGMNKGMFPKSDLFYSQEISLPMYSHLTEEEIDFISRSLLNLI